ncbi:uncharacterized protein VTP21DRAFT_5643 [Calcarisporiella thermophila]|uniref:uncharacterized protein n=1 Tax=Calcarisporiella thermophila TaxID=911321 RepID=UPI0037439336
MQTRAACSYSQIVLNHLRLITQISPQDLVGGWAEEGEEKSFFIQRPESSCQRPQYKAKRIIRVMGSGAYQTNLYGTSPALCHEASRKAALKGYTNILEVRVQEDIYKG